MSDCIEWWGTINSNGYGVYWKNGKSRYAHRMIYTECFGEIPPGMFICHRCDNPPCVNPEHLFVGTPGDNVQDMIAKGRANTPGAPRRTECKRGHPLSGDNVTEVKRARGGVMRVCRASSRLKNQRYRARKRLEVTSMKKPKQ